MGQRIKCVHCEDIIESKFRHDFHHCKCGRISIDGGNDYTRIGFMSQSDYTLEPDLAPEELTWGTLGKDGKGPYRSIKLGACETDHLEAILRTQTQISAQYKEAIKKILQSRVGETENTVGSSPAA